MFPRPSDRTAKHLDELPALAERTAKHLGELPALAERTVAPLPQTVDADTPGRNADELHVRPLPGPRLPPGLDLDCIDRALAKPGSPDLLAKLEQCVRVVGEECAPETWRTFPDRAAEADWESETTWLLATIGWWATNDWCSEWITGEIETIRTTLIERIERRCGWTHCALCGGQVTTYATELLDVAECLACQRVIRMHERESLTTSQAALMLGISEAAVRKQIERGKLRKVGRRGKESLVATIDGLDWARQKLGIPTRCGGTVLA